MERKLRKNQDRLYITGCGILVLSLWSIIKTVLIALLDKDYFFKVEGITNYRSDTFKYALIVVLVLMLIDLLFRIYVFRKATLDAANRKKKGGGLYVVITCWFAVLSAFSIWYYCNPDNLMVSIGNAIVSIAFELTSLVTSVELIYSAVTVKKLRKALREQEN